MRTEITDILKSSGLDIGTSYSVESLSGDGSDRRFYRILSSNGLSYLLVFPGALTPRSTGEALSCQFIGSHLWERGVPVPRIYFFDRGTGGIIYEDLGDLLLHDLVKDWPMKSGGAASTTGMNISPRGESCVRPAQLIYVHTLDALLALQIKGVVGFKAEYCWQSAKYDQALILEKETHYFLDSYCRGFLGLSDFSDELLLEFCELAARAVREPGQYLLHRDFQSRNIMICHDEVRIIDFQGARFGPLAYDVASIVNDPYVDLPYSYREFLLDYYIEAAQRFIYLDRDSFLEGYYHIALLRNLQVLGAFAFLSMIRGKEFFREYIEPAVCDLSVKLSGPLGGEYPTLKGLVQKCIKKNIRE